ncbi:g4022 [Coccomyxa elongata]
MRKTILELRTRARCDENVTNEERVGLLTEALAIKPDSPELLVHRAYCYHLAGDPEAMELDICTAIALASDSAVSYYGTPAVEGRFFCAIARVTMGYIQGVVFDLRICMMMLQGNKAAVQDVQQELSFWESFLNGPHDAGKHSPVAEACLVQEALGVILAQEARDEAAEDFSLLLTEAYASLWQHKNPCTATAASTEPPIMLRGEQTALWVKKTDAPDSPRSVTAGPGSSAPSSPPESPRSADLAPAQHISAFSPCTCGQEPHALPNLQQVATAHESITTAEATHQHQDVQNKVISASSSVINVAAAMAAVGNCFKKAIRS